MSALSGAYGSPEGGGIRAMTASNTSGTPFPSFALIGSASVASSISISEIDCLVPSRSALARSILLMTGMIVRLLAIARFTLAIVWACTPCVASTSKRRAFAGRQTARDFIGKVDVTRRIDQMQGIRLPILGLIPNRDRVGLDRDSAFTLQVHRVENLVF